MKARLALWILAILTPVACGRTPQPTESPERRLTALPLPLQWTSTVEILSPTSTVAPQPVLTARPNEREAREGTSIWEFYAISDGLDLREPGRREFSVDAASELPLVWPFYWCAADEARLAENLPSIAVEFSIGSVGVAASEIREFEAASEEWSCHYWATMLTEWGSAPLATLTVTYTLSTGLNDGYSVYPAGEYSYHLTVHNPPEP